MPTVQANGIDMYYEVQGAGELYAARPEYIGSLAEFVRGRPMPPVDAFMGQSGAVLAHDASAVLGSITAPTLITFGQHDQVTSTRFAGPLQSAIAGAELTVSKAVPTPRSTRMSTASTPARWHSSRPTRAAERRQRSRGSVPAENKHVDPSGFADAITQ